MTRCGLTRDRKSLQVLVPLRVMEYRPSLCIAHFSISDRILCTYWLWLKRLTDRPPDEHGWSLLGLFGDGRRCGHYIWGRKIEGQCVSGGGLKWLWFKLPQVINTWTSSPSSVSDCHLVLQRKLLIKGMLAGFVGVREDERHVWLSD